jgi:hypothetical protein
MADANAKDGAGAADYICSRAVPSRDPLSASVIVGPEGVAALRPPLHCMR